MFVSCCRVQRCALLEDANFHQTLVSLVCGDEDSSNPVLTQKLALEILTWIVAVYTHEPSRK